MGDEQSQSPMTGFYPMSHQTNLPSEKADLIDKIRADTIVTTLKHLFMGEELVRGKWESNPALKSRALTEAGASALTILMLSASSQNVSISRLSDDDIRERTKSIVHTAMKMCIRNWKEFGVLGSDQISFVKEIVLTNTFVTLKQPEGGSIQKLVMGTQHEQRLIQSEEKKSGIIDRVFRK